jgi:DNA-binding NtrC family response regulator
MATSDATQKELAILVGVDDENVAQAMQLLLPHLFDSQYRLRVTVKNTSQQIRTASTVYDFDLVLLFINSMVVTFSGDRFAAALGLIEELKTRTESAVILMLTYQPPGFTTQAEQAGVDGIIELPYTLERLKQTITTALECRANQEVAAKQSEERARRRAKQRPRVVLLDDSAQILQMVGTIVWDCWPEATVVACTDSQKAWEELQRTPPDLFITDLSHGGISGEQLIARLAEQEVRYPIVVLSGNLPKREAEVRAAAGTNLRLSCWEKPINGAEFAEGLKALLD